MNLKTLCFAVLLAGCGAHARDAIVRAPAPESAGFGASTLGGARDVGPFTGNGSGVRRIDAALP